MGDNGRERDVQTAPAGPASAPPPSFPARYTSPRKVASGGMGDLYRIHDTRLGRDVVLKRLRASSSEQSTTLRAFEREAALQASLGHPGIVSVFDLGRDDAGHPYFTMPEIQGGTLAEALDAPPTQPARPPWSRRALLEVLARVSLTVAFAHDKGVLHLDLKPENIMLGDFGEVYVLDWGVARSRALDRPGTPVDAGADDAPREAVGTPHYMAPEQAAAIVAADERADVFALGAILFEVLTAGLLRDAGSTWDALQAAKRDAAPGPRLAAARVPLELADLCAKATAFDRDARLSSARAINEALERWLDGERDVGLRKEAATAALGRARAAREAAEPVPAVMRHLSRAVTLDPSCEPAIQELSSAMLASAATVPESAARELEADARREGKRAALIGLVTYAAWFALLPLALVVGVRSFAALGLIVAPAFASMVASFAAYRLGWTPRLLAAAILSSYLCIAGFASAFGPLLILPALITANSIALLPLARDRPGLRWLVFACAVGAFVLPLGLEWVHVLPPSYTFDDGRMVILPRLIELPSTGATVILTVGALLNILSTHFSVASSVKQQLALQTASLSQAHVLKELLPDALRAVAPRRPEDGYGDRLSIGGSSLPPGP